MAAKKELFLTAQHFEQVLDSMPSKVYIKDKSHRFVFVNNGMCEAHGLTKEEMVGKTDAFLFSAEHASKARRDEKEILKSGKTIKDIEKETYKKKKRVVYVDTIKSPLLGKDGKTPIGIFGVSREINMGVWHALFDSPNDAIYLKNRKGEYILYNDCFQKLLPSSDDVTGKTAKEIYSGDDELINEINREDEQVWGGEPCIGIERRLTTVDGRVRIGLTNKYPVDIGNGTPEIVFGISRDVTEMRLQFDLYETLLDSIPGFVFVKDENFRFKYANLDLANFMGKLSGKDLVGKTDEMLGVSERQCKKFQKIDRQVLEGDGNMHAHDEKITRPGELNQVRRLATRKKLFETALFNKSREIEKFVLGIAIDVTQWIASMKAAEENWNALMENCADCIYLKDQQHRYRDVSKSLARLAGKTRQEAIGKTHEEFFGHLSSHGPEIRSEEKRLFAGTEASITGQREIVTSSGVVRRGETRKVLIATGDKFDEPLILGISRDVTAEQNEKVLEGAVSFISRHMAPEISEEFRKSPGREFEEKVKPRERWLTIVFCDIRGFSATSQTLLKRENLLAGFLKDYFQAVVKTARNTRGLLDKFIGDGAMILFGCFDEEGEDTTILPREQQDEKIGIKSALDACRFALELQREFRVLKRKWEKRFDLWINKETGIELGIGISADSVLVGLFGTTIRDQYTALGHGVNLASRIEACAGRDGRGNILLSKTVKTRVNDEFKLKEEASTKKIKNIFGEYKLWSLLGARDLPGDDR